MNDFLALMKATPCRMTIAALVLLLSLCRSPCMLLLLLGALALAARLCVHLVPVGECKILMGSSGKAFTLDQGIHLNLALAMNVGPGPWRRFKTQYCPAPGTIVSIDPPVTSITTADGIVGSVDVAIQCKVNEWDVPTMLNAQNVCFQSMAFTRVNQWLAITLGRLPAHELHYGNLSKLLNEEASLAELNSRLGDLFLSVHVISLDPSGITLSPTWTSNRDKANQQLQLLSARAEQLTREIEVDGISQTKETQRLRHQEEKAKQEAQIEARCAEIKVRAATERAVIEARAAADQALVREQQAIKVAELESQAALVRQQQAVKVAELESQAQQVAHQAEAARVRMLVEAGLDPRDVANMQVAQATSQWVCKSSGTKLLAVPPGLLGLHGVEGVSGALSGSPPVRSSDGFALA